MSSYRNENKQKKKNKIFVNPVLPYNVKYTQVPWFQGLYFTKEGGGKLSILLRKTIFYRQII